MILALGKAIFTMGVDGTWFGAVLFFLPMAKFFRPLQKKFLDFFVRFTRYKYIPYRKKWACTTIFDFFGTKKTLVRRCLVEISYSESSNIIT